MTALVTVEMPERERPISEQFRIVAKEWVVADSAARNLEERKAGEFARLCLKQGDGLSVAKAEMLAKASEEWTEFIDRLVDAKTQANLKRMHMKFLEIRFSEWQAMDANNRSERRLSR